MAEAATVVTSENYAEFAAQKLGLANEEAPAEAVVENTPTEPVVEAEVESGALLLPPEISVARKMIEAWRRA